MTSLNIKKIYFFSNTCSNFNSIKIRPSSIEHAYLAILNNDLDTALEIFSGIDSPRAIWGKVLVSILKGYLKSYPTYFQIRNFLEIDLDFLLKNEKIDYVEFILGALDELVQINQETYKFAARVMFENKLYQGAFNYMQKSKLIYYNDAELHFMLSKYYFNVHDYEEAEFYINECLHLIPDYYPAIVFKSKIEEMLF